MVLSHRDGPLVFVDDLEDPSISEDDRHHLARVLRIRPGTPMVVGDGAGAWRRGVFADRVAAGLDGLGGIERTPAPQPALTVGVAVVKGDRPELVVQKLTELGIDRIVPFVAEHTVVRWDRARAAKQHQRFVRIAREASMQCRRVYLPRVDETSTFAELVSGDLDPVLADVDGAWLGSVVAGADAANPNAAMASLPTCVLIGPEGGWSDAERAAVAGRVRLGAHILRAETAAIAAGTLLAAARDAGPSGVPARPVGDGEC